MHYKVEPARYEHLPWLRMLFMRWMIEQPVTYPEADENDVDNFTLAIAEKLRLADPDFIIFVAIKGRRVVGFGGGDIQTRLLGKPKRYARGLWLYVVPKHRTHHCAVQIIDAAMQWALDHDVDVVETDEMGDHKHWQRRGLKPYLTKYYLSIADLRAVRPKTHETNGVTEPFIGREIHGPPVHE